MLDTQAVSHGIMLQGRCSPHGTPTHNSEVASLHLITSLTSGINQQPTTSPKPLLRQVAATAKPSDRKTKRSQYVVVGPEKNVVVLPE